MPEFFVKTDVLRTTTGTQDFTVSGFGTPASGARGAIFLVSNTAADGTAVTTKMALGMGFIDGSRIRSVSLRNGDNNTSTGINNSRSADILASDGTNYIGLTVDSWIPDGIRMTVTVLGGTGQAWKVSCALIGGAGIANVYVNHASSHATKDSATTITDPNFQADFLLTAEGADAGPGTAGGSSTFTDAEQDSAIMVVGAVQRTGSDPPPQFASMWAAGFSGTSTMRSEFDTAYAGGDQTASVSKVEFREFSSTGFKAYTRLQNGARKFMYMAVKLNGLTCKALQFSPPQSGGAQAVSGIGIKSQFAFLVQSALIANDTQTSGANAEVLGLAVVTEAAQACYAVWNEDAQALNDVECVSHTRPIFLRRTQATFMDATHVSFATDVWNMNLGTADGTARKWGGLFVELASTPPDPFVKVEIRGTPTP